MNTTSITVNEPIDPILLATLITTASSTMVLALFKVFKYVKNAHFKMACSDCCKVDAGIENQDDN